MVFDESGQVVPGCAVFTHDGDQIGAVKEVRGRFFKVDAPMRPDYWLSRDLVATATRDAVTLSVDKKHLGDVKVRKPDESEAVVEQPSSGASNSTVGANAPIGDYGPGNSPANVVGGNTTWNEVAPTYRQAWEQQHADVTMRWEDAEPGYRYGHEMAGDERYRGRQWSEAEADLKDGYSAWATGHGYTCDERSWARILPGACQAWERVRGT
jgi:hypothetical protein